MGSTPDTAQPPGCELRPAQGYTTGRLRTCIWVHCLRVLERKPLKITKVETVLSAYMVKVKVTVDGEPSTPPLYRPGHRHTRMKVTWLIPHSTSVARSVFLRTSLFKDNGDGTAFGVKQKRTDSTAPGRHDLLYALWHIQAYLILLHFILLYFLQIEDL